MKRADVLDTARTIVTKDRQATHGKPEDTFGTIAGLWAAYLGVPVLPHDVAALLALLKVGRIRANPAHDDNWIDLAGYAACGAELVPGQPVAPPTPMHDALIKAIAGTRPGDIVSVPHHAV